jgi:hypothetical protein
MRYQSKIVNFGRRLPVLYPKQKHVVVPRETKFGENRVGLTPVGLSELARRHPDYTFEIQEGAGELSKYADRDYLNAGRQGQVLVSNNLEVMIGKASHLIKFKEPTADEISLFKKNSKPIVFFGYGHFASSRALSLTVWSVILLSLLDLKMSRTFAKKRLKLRKCRDNESTRPFFIFTTPCLGVIN